MSLLQDEQLETIEKQGRSRMLYSVEFFLTVLVSIIVAGWSVSAFAPGGTSLVPVVIEGIVFAIIIALLTSPWAGRLMPVFFVVALAAFIIVKIQITGNEAPTWFDSPWIWAVGIGVALIALIAWKIGSSMTSDNREAREYEKKMRAEGRW